MRLLRLTSLLLLACALVAPATAAAHGGPKPPAAALHAHYAQAAAATTADPAADPQIQQFLQLAQAHWAASPNCPDGISLERAQWLPDPGVWAAAVQGGCAIAFDPDFYPAPAGYDYGWWQAAMCSVVAHEWGHLLGYGHVNDPSNLMNPVTPINIVAGCPTWGLSAAQDAAATGNTPTTPASSSTRKASKASKAKKKRSTCGSQARSSRRRAKTRRSCTAPAKRRSHRR